MKATVRFSRTLLINFECFTLRLCIFNDLAFSASLAPAEASPIEMHTALISSLSHSTFFYLGLIISELVCLLLLIARAGFSMAFFGRYVPCFASALSLRSHRTCSIRSAIRPWPPSCGHSTQLKSTARRLKL